MTTETPKPTGLALLRAPFPPNQISRLPKPIKKDAPKGRCNECGGWHGLPAVHLDYVGHAALTDRLLDADSAWTWEPAATDERGMPMLDSSGGLWIKLTVCGVTRMGYGAADGKTGGDAMKERIGDALRNAAMRFGAALDLWHKGDLHAHEEDGADDRKPDVAAILKGISGSAGLDVLRANYEAAMQMLPENHHATVRKATNARKAELEKQQEHA
jgi:hypothetical protein